MSTENWRARVEADVAMCEPGASWRLTLGGPPEPVRDTETLPAGFVAAVRRDGGLSLVGGACASMAMAQRDADWWSANDVPGAFVCELREVPRC